MKLPPVNLATRRSSRMTGVLYLSPAAAAVQVGGTLWYGAVAVMLCRLFGDPTRGAGALAIVSAVIGCVFQSLYYAMGLGRGAQLFALAFFGLFLFFLGYLARGQFSRSGQRPRAL